MISRKLYVKFWLNYNTKRNTLLQMLIMELKCWLWFCNLGNSIWIAKITKNIGIHIHHTIRTDNWFVPQILFATVTIPQILFATVNCPSHSLLKLLKFWSFKSSIRKTTLQKSKLQNNKRNPTHITPKEVQHVCMKEIQATKHQNI